MTLSGFEGETCDRDCPACGEHVTFEVGVRRVGSDGAGGSEREAVAACPNCDRIVWSENAPGDGFFDPTDVDRT